jgi:hypothetical protein
MAGSDPNLPASSDQTGAPALDPLQARVDAAAFTLLREGRNPTVSLVRERMGGASPNVVAPALQRWRQTFAAQLDSNSGSALEVLPPGVLELVQALWSRALFEAHRVHADAPSAAQALDRLNVAIAELRDQSARLQARENKLDEQLRDVDQQRRRLTAAESALAGRSSAQPSVRPPPTRRRRTAMAGAGSAKRGRTESKKAGKSASKRRYTQAAAHRAARRDRRKERR